MIIDLGRNPSSEKIRKVISEHIQQNWITSYRYNECTPRSFENSSLFLDRKSQWFNAVLLYVHNIAKKTIQLDFEGLGTQTAKEVSRWNGKGMFCVYTSVLHACLLHEVGVAKTHELQMIQGYYKHDSGGFFRDFLTMCNVKPETQGEHIGVHAWITMCNSILDLSIIQEQVCFDFEDLPWIIEKIPAGMELTGWQENWKTIRKYARKIARESNMTYNEWIVHHQAKMVQLIDRINHEGVEFIAS